MPETTYELNEETGMVEKITTMEIVQSIDVPSLILEKQMNEILIEQKIERNLEIDADLAQDSEVRGI